MRRKFIETEWTFLANGRVFTGHRSEHDNMTLYTIDDRDNVTLMFTDKHIEALRQFLAAMDSSAGTKLIRCKHCDETLLPATSGKWTNVHGDAACEENEQHEPCPDEYEDED